VLLRAAAAGLPGDFNDDGKVDAADYVRWRMNTANGTLPNDNGLATQADRFSLWRANFGNTAGSGSGATASSNRVPEPASALTLIFGVAIVLSGVRQMGR
jgi:hypothetical protein